MDTLSNAADAGSPLHPIETLLAEHRTILATLADIERDCSTLAEGTAAADDLLRGHLHFLEEFDDQIHHDKEEGHLFPALEAAGLSPASGPTATLRSEHRRCRFWRLAISEAIARGDRLRLMGAIQKFVDLQRQHIAKEDQILFPLARRMLTDAAFEAMARAFAERDRAVKGAGVTGWNAADLANAHRDGTT